MNGGRTSRRPDCCGACVSRRPHHLRWGSLAVCLAVAGGCAGYQIGNRSLYPPDLKTIHVPMFQSDSLRLDLGEWLTEAVIKDIELRTPYKVVNDPLADSVLTGRLLSDSKRVISENVNDEPRSLLHNAAVHVMWMDRSGRILTESVVSVGDHFVPEAGQSITTAEHTLMRRLAAQIVSEMEARNW